MMQQSLSCNPIVILLESKRGFSVHSYRSIHMLISFDVNVCIERYEMTNEAV